MRDPRRNCLALLCLLHSTLLLHCGAMPETHAGSQQEPSASPDASTMTVADTDAWRRFYVATDGNDANDGSRSAPFATLDRARQRARELGANWEGDVVISIRGGTYYLGSTLVLEAADSGKNGHRLIFQPYAKEVVTLSGGRPVISWSGPIPGGAFYTTEIPDVDFRHLTVNGRRARRARDPNDDNFHTIARWDPAAAQPGVECAGEAGGRRLGVRDGETWFVSYLTPAQLSRVEVFVERYAGSGILRLGSVGPVNEGGSGIRYIVPKSPERERLFSNAGGNIGCIWQVDGLAYRYENSIAFLDQPGEWFLERASGTPTLFYKPRPGETLNGGTSVVAPVLETLIRFAGSAGNRVRNVVIRGLRLTATTWFHPNREGYLSTYPGVDYRDDTGFWDTYLHPAAIHVEGTERVTLERNVLHALGGMGISLYDHTRETLVDGNAVLEVAGIGIAVDGKGFVGTWVQVPVGEWLLPFPLAHQPHSDGDRVTNNRVQRFGLDYWVAAGIAASYPWGMALEHNEVSEGAGMGIVLGWYGPWTRCHGVPGSGELPPLPPDRCQASTGRNRIVGNRVFRVARMQDDVGGIYTLGHQSPTNRLEDGLVIRGNHVFGLTRPDTWVSPAYDVFSALYIDGDTSFTVVANNIFEVPVGPRSTAIFSNLDEATSVPSHDLRWSDAGEPQTPGDNVTDPGLKFRVRAFAGLSPRYKNVPEVRD